MKRWNTRSRPRASGPLQALALAALLSGACVTRGTYGEVVRERDGLRASERQLQGEVQRLDASSRSLEEERVGLLEGMEDLRVQHEDLEADHVPEDQHARPDPGLHPGAARRARGQ